MPKTPEERKKELKHNLSLKIKKWVKNSKKSLKELATTLWPKAKEDKYYKKKKGGLVFDAEAFLNDWAENILQEERAEPNDISFVDRPIIETDEGEITPGEEEFESKKTIPRTQYLQEVLQEFGYDFSIVVGSDRPEMFREEPYQAYMVQDIDRIVLVNNQEEEATFVIFDSDTEDLFDRPQLKDDLKSRPDVKRIKYEGKESWQNKLRELLEEDYNLKETEGRFLSFDELKKEVQAAGVESSSEYQEEQKEHDNWPSTPNRAYSKQWSSWYDFLGKEKPKERFLGFNELQKEIQAADIMNRSEYRKEQKEHDNWPSQPYRTYSEQWIDWYDFLEKEKPEYISFNELKKEVQSAGIESRREYREEQKEHNRWPSNPVKYYQNKWKNWYDFLGKEKSEYLNFSELKKEVQATGIESHIEYIEEQKKHDSWPSTPDRIYSEQWTNWYDFLDKEKPEEKLSFNELKKEVQAANINTQREYREEQKEHNRWPSKPEGFYQNKWKNWYDFLGKEK
ncbi:MAG: integrase repeat-containing protein [Candidatus Magasanikbacteria bacterium]